MRSATTDPPTGLGNRRRVREELEDGELRRGRGVSVCLLDLDGLKRLNDTLGHEQGDRALKAVAARLDAGGEAFRIGGDEFALVLLGVEAEEARPLVEALLVDLELDGEPLRSRAGSRLTATPTASATWSRPPTRRSTGASAPRGRVGIAEARRPVVRRRDGRRARGEHPGGDEPRSGLRGRRGPQRERRVALAPDRARLAVPADEAALSRWPRVHDLGKVAVPEEFATSRGHSIPTSSASSRGTRPWGALLGSTRLDRIADWVCHHHERWDGEGYPDGQRGEEVPLASRIIAVAEAYGAMTSQRAYAGGRAHARRRWPSSCRRMSHGSSSPGSPLPPPSELAGL